MRRVVMKGIGCYCLGEGPNIVSEGFGINPEYLWLSFEQEEG